MMMVFPFMQGYMFFSISTGAPIPGRRGVIAAGDGLAVTIVIFPLTGEAGAAREFPHKPRQPMRTIAITTIILPKRFWKSAINYIKNNVIFNL
jgi:hypothetical protein